MTLSVADILHRLPSHRQTALRRPLDHGAVQTLRGLAAGPLRVAVTDEAVAPLVAAGYARQTPSGYLPTEAGQFRAMMEEAGVR